LLGSRNELGHLRVLSVLLHGHHEFLFHHVQNFADFLGGCRHVFFLLLHKSLHAASVTSVVFVRKVLAALGIKLFLNFAELELSMFTNELKKTQKVPWF
jgi:hypothetical protein